MDISRHLLKRWRRSKNKKESLLRKNEVVQSKNALPLLALVAGGFAGLFFFEFFFEIEFVLANFVEQVGDKNNLNGGKNYKVGGNVADIEIVKHSYGFIVIKNGVYCKKQEVLV